MSAAFYLTYRGKPIRFVGPRTIEEVPAVEATQFISEADAWWKAHQTGLMPQHVHVHSAQIANEPEAR